MHLVTISTKGKVPTARLGHSATLINDKSILIFGGADPSQVHNDCYTFDTGTALLFNLGFTVFRQQRVDTKQCIGTTNTTV